EDMTVEHLHGARKTLVRQLHRICPAGTRAVGWTDLKVRLAGYFDQHIHMIVFGCTEAQLKAAEPRTLKKARRSHPRLRKGKAINPWDVESVKKGDEQWTTAYVVRQFPKRGE